jgi:hypothetical protein
MLVYQRVDHFFLKIVLKPVVLGCPHFRTPTVHREFQIFQMCSPLQEMDIPQKGDPLLAPSSYPLVI